MIAALTLLTGCATKIHASSSANPPPAEAFSAFGRIQLKPAVFTSNIKGNEAALAKINDNIVKELTPSLTEWNKRPDNGRTLVIEPVVEQFSFKRGARRVLLGPMAGSSGILMRVTYKDNNGRVVAKPEFFQRAAALAGGWTFGVHDNLMLMRVAQLSANYTKSNFTAAVGGPTGGDDPEIAPDSK
ncbi:MAG TPA: hypothetical protein VGC21_11215 [Telluria sp.]